VEKRAQGKRQTFHQPVRLLRMSEPIKSEIFSTDDSKHLESQAGVKIFRPARQGDPVLTTFSKFKANLS
jgi:hypothetical protein